MTDRVFVDSNIWVYLFTSDDDTKNKTVKQYITENMKTNLLVISYQVVNEVCCVLKKKKYTEPEIRRVADDMIAFCELSGYTTDIIFIASELRERYSFSYWDSYIVASALESQCDVLASEDMQGGLRINNMIIENVLKKEN